MDGFPGNDEDGKQVALDWMQSTEYDDGLVGGV